jgi:hypothetical protein
VSSDRDAAHSLAPEASLLPISTTLNFNLVQRIFDDRFLAAKVRIFERVLIVCFTLAAFPY